MIVLAAVMAWTLAFIGLAVLLWRMVRRHIKVYLFIVLDMIYLCGVFYLFSFMDGSGF